MRRINVFVTSSILLLFLIHAVTGIFKLTGLISGGDVFSKCLSFIMAALVAVHMIIGIILTVSTLKTLKGSGRSYFKDNELFWIRRFSGVALIFFIFYHVIVFTGKSGDVFRLNTFGWIQMIAMIFMVAALFVHLLCNIRPLLTAIGIENKKFLKDFLVVMSVVLLVAAAAFVIYFLRWNFLWRYR